MLNPTDYDLACVEIAFARDIEERFRQSLSRLDREDYDKHVKEVNRLTHSWCATFSSRDLMEAEPHIKYVQDQLWRVARDRAFWMRMRTYHAERDLPPMVIKTIKVPQ